jgi:hypothetical protein
VGIDCSGAEVRELVLQHDDAVTLIAGGASVARDGIHGAKVSVNEVIAVPAR